MIQAGLHRALVVSLCACGVAAAWHSAVGAESLDERLFRQINGRWQRPWLDRPMSALSAAGDAKIGIAVCAGVGLFGGQRGYRAAKLALAADAGSALVTYGLKCAVNRARPDGIADRPNSSFPSGHATGAFALAAVFGHEYPGLAIPCYTVAAGIALSRVYRGRHYPSDVLAGAAIGFGCARLALHFRDRILGFELPPRRAVPPRPASSAVGGVPGPAETPEPKEQ